MGIPAIVAAGDRGAAKAVGGKSKAFLEIGEQPLVARTVLALQAVPEVSEVWVIGDAARLESVLGRPEVRAALTKPLHVVEQRRNLLENLWEGYRRSLGGESGEAGAADPDGEILYLSADLPFATPQEIAQFVRRAEALDCDYALGMVGEESMRPFLPTRPGGPGIRMATFNLREGRLRQSNLHLVRPARLRHRELIQRMYEHRHQRELWPIVALSWQLLRSGGGPTALYYFLLMHLAGVADRRGWRRLADLVRSWIPIARIERGCSDLLGTDFRFVTTDVGGCAIDIDTEEDLAAARARFSEWRAQQEARAAERVGALPLARGEEAS